MKRGDKITITMDHDGEVINGIVDGYGCSKNENEFIIVVRQ